MMSFSAKNQKNNINLHVNVKLKEKKEKKNHKSLNISEIFATSFDHWFDLAN